jgi:hypothetical protein
VTNGAIAIVIIGGLGVLILSGTVAKAAGKLGGGTVPLMVMQWADLSNKYAQIYANLDPEEILAIIWNESTGNPNATNPSDPSWGLMGVTFLIGQGYAGITDPSQLLNPDTNVKAGAGFLSHLKSKYGDQPDWPDAYNVGEPKFDAGVRSPTTPTYSQRFFSHLAQLAGLA